MSKEADDVVSSKVEEDIASGAGKNASGAGDGAGGTVIDGLPKTMKAVRKLEKKAGFELVTVPLPVAGPGEVLLKVLAASLCGTDGKVWKWLPPFSEGRLTPPITTGHEVCAEVVGLGEGVTSLALGDLVSAESHIPCASQGVSPPCHMCATGNAHICERVKFFSVDVDGFLAEYSKAPANILWKNPADMPHEIAALQESLGNSVYTVEQSNVRDKTVAIFGLGPTGLNCIPVAKALGAKKVIAVAGSAEHIALAKTMGAHVVVNRHEEDVLQRLRDETDGHGPEVCLEMSGSKYAFGQALDAVMTTGQITILAFYKEPLHVDVSKKVVLKDVTVRGIYGRRIWSTWELTSRLLGEGMDVTPIVTHRFNGLTRFKDGFEAMAAGICGKCVFFPHRTGAESSSVE